MPILNIQNVQIGESGISPGFIFIDTNDTLAEVTTAGYLTTANQTFGIPLSEAQMALVTTKTTPNSQHTNTSLLSVVRSGSAWSLTEAFGPGNVTLPTIANHLAVYTDTEGTLSEDAATAINAGNIQAGTSAVAGYLSSFAGTGAFGEFRFKGVANSGNFIVNFSNAAMGQDTTISVPNPVNATATTLLSTAAITAGNMVVASATSGVLSDSGAKILAGISPPFAGGGTTNTFTISGLVAQAHGSCVIRTSTNSVSITKALPGTNQLAVTFSADPGAGTTLDYIYANNILS